MRVAIVTLTLALLGACATPANTASARPEETYRVIQPDARISFSRSNIDGFTVGPKGAVLMKTRDGGLYRLTLQRPCEFEANFAEQIAFENDARDTVDKFSKLRVNGRECWIDHIDRVEKVKPS